jgi:hypothetical protein
MATSGLARTITSSQYTILRITVCSRSHQAHLFLVPAARGWAPRPRAKQHASTGTRRTGGAKKLFFSYHITWVRRMLKRFFINKQIIELVRKTKR